MYQTLIRHALARVGRLGVNPAMVEAWMRLEHGTLDALDARAFGAEVAVAVQCIDADPVGSIELARSYGLWTEGGQS